MDRKKRIDDIQHVSDTALWVAHYRALESERSDSLFQDPFAKLLVGDRGRIIAEGMKGTSRFAHWSVVIRTCVIDRFIQTLVQEGIDTVINLGAGLDTRPYRLRLPTTLRWIEIDFPHMIEHKAQLLSSEKPVVKLERIPCDLSDQKQRRALFAKLAAGSTKALVITEGVIPYLSEEQVADLADDLLTEKSFHFWVAEYFSNQVYRYFKRKKRREKMKNAPFQFFPTDWFGFFRRHGWEPREIRYLPEESQKMKRAHPLPWWALLLRPFTPKAKLRAYQQHVAYVLYQKVSSKI